MCGIAGIIESPDILNVDNIIDEFSKFNMYRGPDYYGRKTGDLGILKYGISHHRLSIIDLNESANQPMVCNDWEIVFNGEIYNYKELKNSLINAGVEFSTNSDTEVILKLLENFPIKEALSQLNGMFAIGLINKKTYEVIVARDRWGKKPIYYYHNQNHFSFSSDFRSFSKLEKKFTLNKKGIKYYFCELSFPQPETIFNEISQVKPGCYIVYKNGKLIQSQYIDLFKNEKEDTIIKNNFSSPAEAVKGLLSDAIKTRLEADVPVGSFLSGGIDSGIIVALSAKYTQNLNTYTVGFDNTEFDERPYANILAKKYNTNHHELLLKSNDIDIEKLIMEFGEPFADSSMIPSYLISKKVSEHQKVVLSGDGGDELFCGNQTFSQAYKFDNLKKKLDRYRFLNSILDKIPNDKVNKLALLQKKPIYFSGRELYRNIGFQENEVHKLFNEGSEFSIQDIFELKIRECCDNDSEVFKNIYFGGIRTRLLNDYLVKIDRASMYASLEIRSPFLDDHLFNYVKQLDKKDLMPNYRLKSILKDLASDLLPEEILNKPKTGFAIPIDEWIVGKWRTIFEEVVLEKKQNIIDFNYDFINNLWKKQLSGEKHGHKLYSILVFHIWTSNFFSN